jgi:hypothetical protein
MSCLIFVNCCCALPHEAIETVLLKRRKPKFKFSWKMLLPMNQVAVKTALIFKAVPGYFSSVYRYSNIIRMKLWSRRTCIFTGIHRELSSLWKDLKFIIFHNLELEDINTCKENEMTVEFLIVCQFIRNMKRGIILNIETSLISCVYKILPINILYKCIAHAEEIIWNFQCGLRHNRTRCIKFSAFVIQYRKNCNKSGKCMNYNRLKK